MIEYDIAVIGGGMAGRTAAKAAVELGARTILIDEHEIDREPPQLTARSRTVAWGLFPGFRVGLAPAGGQSMIAVKRVILATGSTEEVLAFPGSDLPGVMTARGLLRLLNEHHVWPGGKRVVVIGESRYAGELGRTVENLGGELVYRADRSEREIEAFAEAGVLSGARIDGREYSCDILAVSLREVPDVALAAMMECEIGYSQALGGFTPRRSDCLETTVSGLFICGGIAGIGTPDEYRAEARVAALAAAQSLELVASDRVERAIDDLRCSLPERAEDAKAIARSWAQHAVSRSIAVPIEEL
jgi:thioredoxin reductase